MHFSRKYEYQGQIKNMIENEKANLHHIYINK